MRLVNFLKSLIRLLIDLQNLKRCRNLGSSAFTRHKQWRPLALDKSGAATDRPRKVNTIMARTRIPKPGPGVIKKMGPALYKSGAPRLRDDADPQLEVVLEIDGRDYTVDVLEEGCPRISAGDVARLVRPAVAVPFGDRLILEADGLILDDEIDLDGEG